MPETQTDNANEMKKYVVVRAFHLGEAGVNLTAGDTVQFDGANLILDKTHKSYEAPSLRLAIMANHLVEDDGNVHFKKPEPVVRPAPKIVIQDHEEMVVARVKLPDKIAGRKRQATEEVAKKTAKDKKPLIIVDDQRVVGKANVRNRGPQAAMVSDQEAEAIATEQEGEAKVVTSNTKSRIARMLEAEGITGDPVGSTPVIIGDGDYEVVGRIKSVQEREAELRANNVGRGSIADQQTTPEEEAALKADIELAKAKRDGRAPTGVRPAPEAPEGVVASNVRTASAPVKTGDHGYPVGFPHDDHWRRRLDWCRTNSANVGALILIYKLATEPFQNRMVKEFTNINFE